MSDLIPDRRIKLLPRPSDGTEDSAFSPSTGKTYESWIDLVQHEAVGFVAVVVDYAKPLRPWMAGPFLVESEAVKAKRKMARAAKRAHPEAKVGSTTRILWKDRT